MWFMFKKNCLTQEILIDSPVHLYPRSQLHIWINSTNIRKKFEISSGRAYSDQEKLFDEKTEDKKSRDTIPLKSTINKHTLCSM